MDSEISAETLGTLIAESACRSLVLDYAVAVDAGEFERLREIFAADAVFARPTAPDAPIQGLEAIVAAFRSRPLERIGFHLTTAVRIRVESPSRASGDSRVLLFSADAATAPAGPLGRRARPQQLVGVYRDVFCRTPAGWRIQERRGQVLMHSESAPAAPAAS